MLKVLDESIDLAKRFENVLTLIQNTVAFDPIWRSNNGNGYDGAVNVKLAPGKVVKSRDPVHDRRMILIGTQLDTVVIYERLNPNRTQTFSLVYNANAALDFLLGGSFLSIAQFSLAITDYDPTHNIGTHLENLYGRIQRRVGTAKTTEQEVTSPK